MENKKIKLLIMASDGHGVGHFRSIWPAQQIQKDFSHEFEVEIGHNVWTDDINYFKQFDIVHFHRQMGPFETMMPILKQLREHGTIVIMDIDDYWEPPKTHPLHMAAIKEKIPEKTINTFKNVDCVTTTTEIFATHIRKHNKNVFIMPNALDMEHKMWQDEDTKKTDKCRITWIGGSSHKSDLEILIPSMKLLHNDPSLKDKFQIIMCGYDVRGNITQIHPDGSQDTRKIEPHETVWNKFEEIFTDGYNPNLVSEDYKNYLKRYKNEPYNDFDVYKGNYVRRWTLPLTQYGKHYNYCDVCLAPLADNIFNEVKSELKLIESGMKNKVLIAQDYSIHGKLMTHGENGLLITKSMNPRGWYESMKKVILDKDYRNMLANNLHEFVKDKYSLKNVTKDRVDIYKRLLEERKSKIIVKEELIQTN